MCHLLKCNSNITINNTGLFLLHLKSYIDLKYNFVNKNKDMSCNYKMFSVDFQVKCCHVVTSSCFSTHIQGPYYPQILVELLDVLLCLWLPVLAFRQKKQSTKRGKVLLITKLRTLTKTRVTIVNLRM